MSKYTTEVRFICETFAGLNESAGYGSIDNIIEKAIPMVFDFDFPIFDSEYRMPLCKKILKHYYTREIGLETVGLWKHFLSMKLNEIMPYYNQLYKSAVLEFNPLYDVDVTTEHHRVNVGDSNGTNSAHSSGNSENWDVFSDTPQGALTNVQNDTYLTNARKNTNNASNEQTGSHKTNVNNTEDYIQTVKGRHGGVSSSKLLKEFRSTFLNIDVMIIEELADLFMNLW